MIRYERDGSITLIDDSDGSRLTTLPAGTSGEDLAAEAIAWGAAPAPARRLLPKVLVHQRLVDAGLLDEAWAILASSPDYLGRWLMPGHAEVYADDPDLLNVLGAIGADVAAITAPE